MSSRRRALVLVALLTASTGVLRAQSTLLYVELQALGAYSTASKAVELFSLMPGDVMQKPSLGFDLVHRFSGRSRDVGVLAVQARLAYDQDGAHKVEPQLYNAYFRLKAGFADVWAGHNRPALGLSSVLDNHALLLPSPAMLGYGFDRDWGVGLEKDLSWGGVAASLTTGSGMPLYLKGNYLAAARIFKGVLARDNYSAGLSLSFGRLLETMGYHLVGPEPVGWLSAGLDISAVWRNLENRAELLWGRRAGAPAFLFFWRSGLSLLEEGRLKIELQPAVTKSGGAWDYSFGSGLSYLLSADLAGRFMAFYDHGRHDARFVFQLYFYKRL